MQHVLILSRHNSIRGPIAAACIKKFKKCEALITIAGLDQKELNPKTAGVLVRDGLTIPENAAITNETHLDYVITVCDEAKDNLPSLAGNPLLFHYHFRELSNESDMQEFTELHNTMKQYFERFCKMYLNEFS